jgi:hypothetical protein
MKVWDCCRHQQNIMSAFSMKKNAEQILPKISVTPTVYVALHRLAKHENCEIEEIVSQLLQGGARQYGQHSRPAVGQ